MDASFSPARFKRFLSGITRFIALTFIIVSSFHDAYSARGTLGWDPNTEPDLAGYKLYDGTASVGYAQVIDVGNTTMYTVANLTAGATYYFAVTAHDASGYESEHSNEVSATIVQQYRLIASKGGTGTGTITYTGINCGNECANTYKAGTPVTLTATPEAGSIFGGWSGDGCTGTGLCVMNMNANMTVTAMFNAATYITTAQSSAGGRISPAGAVPVRRGSDRTFMITPGGGYRIASVSVDGKSAGAVSTYTFRNVTADHWIVATFRKK